MSTDTCSLQTCETNMKSTAVDTTQVMHRTVEIDGQSIFYREAGPPGAH